MPYGRRPKRANRRRRGRGRSRAKTRVDRRQDRAITKLLTQQYRLSQYRLAGTGTGSIQSFALVQPNNWVGIFQSNFRANNTDRCFINNMEIMCNITAGVSGVAAFNPFHYTIFVVSIRKEARLQTLQRLSPQLQTFQQDVDYTQSTIGSTVGNAMWRLNPAIYKVHAIRRGMVGNYSFEDASPDATAVTNITDANKNHRMKVPWRRRIKRAVGEDINGNPLEWKDMTVNEVNTADQLYLLFFNNATADQVVDFAWSVQANTKVPQ